MIVSPDHKLFEQLYWYLYTSRGNEKARNFSCHISSAILAYYLSTVKAPIYIIESLNHSVVYDGQSSWDLHLGIVFKDYKYPSIKIPDYTKIPKFYFSFSAECYESFYNKNNMLRDRERITVKEISNL
ncbi:MAG TPA: hypothetical protein DCM40_06545 [Maribacter sp.]|nr:hypothetical protein [Maribacter sp.]